MSSLSQPHLLLHKQEKNPSELKEPFWNFAQSQGFQWFQPLLAPPALEGKNASPCISDAWNAALSPFFDPISQLPSSLRVKRKLSGSSVSRAAIPAQPNSLELGSVHSCFSFLLYQIFTPMHVLHPLLSHWGYPSIFLVCLGPHGIQPSIRSLKITCAHLGWAFLNYISCSIFALQKKENKNPKITFTLCTLTQKFSF